MRINDQAVIKTEMTDGQVKSQDCHSLKIYGGREAKEQPNERMTVQASTITACAYRENKEGQARGHCP